MFYVCGGFTLFGAIVFGGFAVTDTEPWAKDPDETFDDVKNMAVEVYAKDPDGGKLAYDNKGMDMENLHHNGTTITKL